MNKISLSCFILCCFSLLGLSCTKTSASIATDPDKITLTQNAFMERKVRFLLYTDKSFSQSNEKISFTLVIRDAQHRVLWDSVLAPILAKDIPARSNKLEVVKYVPNHNPSLLQVGFLYSIENIGYSWYLGLFNEGESEKVIEYNFQ